MLACTSALAVAAALGFAASQPIPAAYEGTVQSYQSGDAVFHQTAPQRVRPVAEDSEAAGGAMIRLADGDGGGEQTGVDTASPGAAR